MDNCHLGDKILRQLDVFQDLVPDRDCDVFVRNELSQPGCQPARNWDTGKYCNIRYPHYFWFDFNRVKTKKTHTTKAV